MAGVNGMQTVESGTLKSLGLIWFCMADPTRSRTRGRTRIGAEKGETKLIGSMLGWGRTNVVG